MEILAILPARGGSKGIPRKNIKLLAGEPLIAYSIRAAQESKHISRTIVSTEDEEIRHVALRYGAEVPFVRPAALADDHAVDLDVFQHCLKWLDDNQSYRPEIVVQLRPTAPLRTTARIDEAIDLFLEAPSVDCVRTVRLSPQHPLKMWRVVDGYLTPFVPVSVSCFEEPYNMPRQDLGTAYVQNGSIDVIRTTVITEGNSMSGSRIRPLIMTDEESVNIDSPTDWEMAELLMQRRNAAAGREGAK
jgi:CMP-N-acetylneuraminic acid synthetase